MRGQVREVEESEAGLVRFVRDVAEYRKFGYTVSQAIERCLKNPYPKAFTLLLRKVWARVRLGVGLGEAASDSRSWLTRMAFRLLGEVEETGGGSPLLLEKIVGLLRTHLTAKESARQGIRIYLYMALSIPFIVAFSAALLQNMAQAIAPLAGRSVSGLPITLASPSQVTEALQLALILTLEAVVSMTFLAGRAVDHYPCREWRMALAAAAFIAAVLLYPQLLSATKAMFGAGGGGGAT